MAPIITFLYPAELPADTYSVLEAACPGITVQSVPYMESSELRTSRGAGVATQADIALAPQIPEEQWAKLAESDIVVSFDVPEKLLERLPNLKWIQAIGAGVEHLDHAAIAAANVTLTNAAGLAAIPISEFVMGRLLQVWKHFRHFDEHQVYGNWNPKFGRRVAGLTLGIVGLGAIGRATALRARAFDMTILATRRSATPGLQDPDADQLYTASQLDEMLGQCDAVLICAPATAETEDLFDAARIAAMKPGAVLCNVARGSLVVEDDLVAALESGHLSAAILDVTRREPTPADSPLWSAPNCYLSPHTAVSMDGYTDSLVSLVARNLVLFANDEPLINTVLPIKAG